MANQPKPPPRPEPPKPPPPKPPGQPPGAPPGAPPAAQHTTQQARDQERHDEHEHDDRYEDDDATLDRLKGRDKTGQIPGTPLTPPEGHDHREPAPGEPGGPSGGGGTMADEPVHTIADEQRERSQVLMDKGVETVKAEHDERTEEERRSRPVPGVQHRPIEEHEAGRR
jgi:hypothetical protein